MKNRVLCLLPVAAAFAGIIWAASVSTDYDHKADFGRYHTYSWLGVKAGNSLWQDRITSAVDAQLAAKGLRMGVDRLAHIGVLALQPCEEL